MLPKSVSECADPLNVLGACIPVNLQCAILVQAFQVLHLPK